MILDYKLFQKKKRHDIRIQISSQKNDILDCKFLQKNMVNKQVNMINLTINGFLPKLSRNTVTGKADH